MNLYVFFIGCYVVKFQELVYVLGGFNRSIFKFFKLYVGI